MKKRSLFITWLLLFYLVLSNTFSVFAADKVDNDILSKLNKLKEKQQLYFDDFKVLENNQELVYVINKDSGETFYPQRIKSNDLIDLQNRIKNDKVNDFGKASIPEIYNKYYVYNLEAKDGHAYLVFIEQVQIKVSFTSNKIPYTLYIEGKDPIKQTTNVKEVTLTKGKTYNIKAVYDNDDEKSFILDLTNENSKAINYNISFGISTQTKIIIGIVLAVLVVGILALLYFRPNKGDEGPQLPMEIVEIGTKWHPLDKVVNNPIYIKEEINNLKNYLEVLNAKLYRTKETVIRSENKITDGSLVLSDLQKLEENVTTAINLNQQLKSMVEKLESQYSNVDDLKDDKKPETIQKMCISLANISAQFNKLSLTVDEYNDKALYLQGFNTNNANFSSGYFEQTFKQMTEAMFRMANAIENGYYNLQQNLNEGFNNTNNNINAKISDLKEGLENTILTIDNDLELIMKNLEKNELSQNVNNEKSQAIIMKTLKDYFQKESVYIEQVSNFEKEINSMKGNTEEFVNEIKNILAAKIIEIDNNLERKENILLEKIGALIKENKNYEKRFDRLDKESIILLSEGDFLMELFDKSEWNNYSSAYLSYIKVVERELKNIIKCEENGLGGYIRSLKHYKPNIWFAFINEFENNKFVIDRNKAAHGNLINRDKVEKLRNFLIFKNTNVGQGWLSFINIQKNNI